MHAASDASTHETASPRMLQLTCNADGWRNKVKVLSSTRREDLAHEHARDGLSGHEADFSASDLFESVRQVELYSCERRLDVEAWRPAGNRIRFGQSIESGAD